MQVVQCGRDGVHVDDSDPRPGSVERAQYPRTLPQLGAGRVRGHDLSRAGGRVLECDQPPSLARGRGQADVAGSVELGQPRVRQSGRAVIRLGNQEAAGDAEPGRDVGYARPWLKRGRVQGKVDVILAAGERRECGECQVYALAGRRAVGVEDDEGVAFRGKAREADLPGGRPVQLPGECRQVEPMRDDRCGRPLPLGNVGQDRTGNPVTEAAKAHGYVGDPELPYLGSRHLGPIDGTVGKDPRPRVTPPVARDGLLVHAEECQIMVEQHEIRLDLAEEPG